MGLTRVVLSLLLCHLQRRSADKTSDMYWETQNIAFFGTNVTEGEAKVGALVSCMLSSCMMFYLQTSYIM